MMSVRPLQSIEEWKKSGLITYNQGQHIAHKIIRYMQDRQQNRSRWVSALQSTTVPLRLIIGPQDPVSGAHMAERYRSLIPEPDIVILDGIGHYPQIEDPQSVLRAQYTDQDIHQMRLVHTTEQGETIIAANPLVTNLLPALLFGFMGRPRWLYAFAGGVLASALLGDRFEGQFRAYLQGQRTIVISSQ